MKKSLIIPIAAALLLCAVICTAGCVNNTDPIVGDWIAEDDTSVSYAVFAADNNGAFIYGSEKSSSSETETGYSESSSSQTATVTFNWNVVEPKKTYTLAFADGTTDTAALDAQRGLMTISGVEFEKMVSVLSGSSNGLSEDEKRYYFHIWSEKHPNPTGDELVEIFDILDNWDIIDIVGFISN